MSTRFAIASAALLAGCGGSFQVSKDERPDGVYYDMSCPDWKECISFAHQRCPDGFETVEKRRHAIIIRCSDPGDGMAEAAERDRLSVRRRAAPVPADTTPAGPEGF